MKLFLSGVADGLYKLRKYVWYLLIWSVIMSVLSFLLFRLDIVLFCCSLFVLTINIFSLFLIYLFKSSER